jgi:hypothetical protein
VRLEIVLTVQRFENAHWSAEKTTAEGRLAWKITIDQLVRTDFPPQITSWSVLYWIDLPPVRSSCERRPPDVRWASVWNRRIFSSQTAIQGTRNDQEQPERGLFRQFLFEYHIRKRDRDQMLSLSIGTTTLAGPSCSALK